MGHAACGPTGPRLPWPPGRGPTTHLSPFNSGGKLCLTAATNSATVSSRVKITALAPASNVYATWNHEVRPAQTSPRCLLATRSRRGWGAAQPKREREGDAAPREGLAARGAPPAPALVCPWCALKQCAS